MKELRFEDLYTPEYYLDTPGHDGRIAIKKFRDARDTLAMAKFSLSYIEEEESDDVGRIIARTIHLHHAIEDLNNSFDLLLQVPWFYFRIWDKFNTNGTLRNDNDRMLKNGKEVLRNKQDWVLQAEKECNNKKVISYLKAEQNVLKDDINNFYSIFIYNQRKPFTVRTLCNELKHNHALSFEELYNPYDFNVEYKGEIINLRETNFSVSLTVPIYEKANPSVKLCEVKYDYNDDLSVDIKYPQGELFRFEDCSYSKQRLKISEVYNECCDYFDELVSLFEKVYKQIYPEICLLPSMLGKDGKPNIKTSKDSIDLNKFFTTA